MFNLDTRVHLDEIVVALSINEEFNGTGTAVINMTRDLERIFADGLALLCGQYQRWCEFDDFLVTALDGAVTFKHVNKVAMLVTEDLYFDVFWMFDVLFNKNVGDPESLLGFAGRTVVFLFHLVFGTHDAHPTAAATGAGLEDDRITGYLGEFFCFFDIEGSAFYTRDGWHADFNGDFLGLDLVTEGTQHIVVRPDEFNPCFFAGFSEFSIFREEAIPRMDGVHAFRLGQSDDTGDVQICIYWGLAFPYTIRFICDRTIERIFIFFGINSDALDPQLFAGAENTDRDLAAVCN